MSKYKIVISPLGKETLCDEETRLMTALKSAGVEVKSTCGGKASCGECKVKILGGDENLVPAEFKETTFLGNVFHITKERLSCQTFIQGDIVVDVTDHLGVRLKRKPTLRRTSKEVEEAKQNRIETEERPLVEKEGGKKRPNWKRRTKKSNY